MIWTFVGETQDTRKDINKLLSLLQKKQPDAEVLRVDNDSFDPMFLDEIISSQGLFSPKYIIVLEGIDLKVEKNEVILEKLPAIKESEHAFIMTFQKLLADPKKKFTKYSYEIKEYEKKEKAEKKENNFEMADRIGERDVVGLWQLYAKKITEGTSPEEIHGMFVWQVKGMLVAMKTNTAAEANMNEYPYTKAKRFAKNYTQKELEELLFELVSMYDAAHDGRADLAVELEKWVLGLGKK